MAVIPLTAFLFGRIHNHPTRLPALHVIFHPAIRYETENMRKKVIVPEFIAAPQNLRRKAVSLTVGIPVVLTPETAAKLEKVIASHGDKFAIEILDKLRDTRKLILEAAEAPDRFLLLPKLANAALEIKGMGTMFGYPLLTVLAKSAHDFVKQLGAVTEPQFEVIRLHVDAMYVVLAQHVSGEGGPTEKEVVKMLREATSKVLKV